MSKYKLFIKRYDILKNDYIVEEREVETYDIYHTIGEIYCKTIEEIKRIDYFTVNEEKELQTRIDKAIEFIDNSTINPDDLSLYDYMTKEDFLLLKDILLGDD